MKNLIATALLLVGMTTFAQEKPERPEKGDRPKMEKFTPEQRSQLRIKQLTLQLDLSNSQQKDLGKILAEADTKRATAKAERVARKDSDKKPTSDERFAMMNKRLDEKIAFKDKLKKVLNPEQMDKWEKMHDQRKVALHDRKKHHGPKREHTR